MSLAAPGGPLVSIVIVHFRTPAVLAVCLERIKEARIGVPMEVIVVDNAPLDDAAELICAGTPGVVYRKNQQNLGFGKAVNQGIRMAAGEFVLVLNPDVEVAGGSIEELIAEMRRDPRAGIVAPRLLYPDGSLQHSCRTFYTLPVFVLRRTFLGRLFPDHPRLREHLMLDYDHESTRVVDWCLGASLLVRRAAVHDVGAMDERFFLYFEDVDWCYRMQARGWHVVYHPASTMIHRYERLSAKRPGRGLLLHLASTFRYYEKWSFVLYMLKRRSSTIRRIVLVASDVAAVNAAFFLAFAARNLSSSFLTKPTFGFTRYARFLVFTNGVALLALALAGMYRSRRREEAGEQVLGAMRALVATALIMMASTFLFAAPVYSRAVVGLFMPLAFLLILVFRWGIFGVQNRVRSHRLHLRRVGVLAPDDDVEALRQRLGRDPSIGLEILPLPTEAAVLERPRGGNPAALEEAIALWVEDERVAEVVLFEDWAKQGADLIIDRLARAGIPVRLVPRARLALRHGIRATDFLGYPALQVAGASLPARSWEKRLVDALCAGLLLLLLLVPYLALRAAALALGRRGVRTTLHGRAGRSLSFSRLPFFPSGGSGLRIVLRDYMLLFACLRGDWSFVGIAPFTADQWALLAAGYRRLPPDAPPGWITLGGSSGSTLESMCGANREYVGRWTLALDVQLVLKSIRGRGARETAGQL